MRAGAAHERCRRDGRAGPAAGAPPARQPEPRRAPGARRVAIGLATLLALLTIATFGYLPRYQPDGRSVLDNADFREGFRRLADRAAW